MKSFTTIAALSALAAVSSAASSSPSPTSTISIPFPAVNPTDLGLSIVTAAPSSTVYAVGCALNAQGVPKNSSCGWVSGFYPYLTLASGLVEFNITASPDEVDTYRCDVSSTSVGKCKTIVVVETDKNKFSTSKMDGEHTTLIYAAATITAGLEKLSTTATTTSASSSGSTGAASSGASSSGASTAASSSSSSGAAARETGALGLLAMAGVAGAGLLL